MEPRRNADGTGDAVADRDPAASSASLPTVRATGPWKEAAIALGLAAAALLLYLPFVPALVTGWDPIQFALGIERFDLAMHQPHPPGYLGHMGLAWLLARLGLATGAAVQWASVVAGAGAVGVAYLLALRLRSRRVALAAAALLATHPLAVSLAGSGETYPLEALASSVLVLAGLTVGRGASRWRIAAFFLVYGLSGGVRQNLPLFFLPFAAWRLVLASAGQRAPEVLLRWGLAGAVGAAGLAAWIVPLLALAGGPGPLLASFGSQFFSNYGGAYSPLLGASSAGVLRNLDSLWRHLAAGLGLAGAAGLALWPFARRRPASGPGLAAVCVAWWTPALLWFVLMYIGKAGHILYLLPPLAIAVASVADRALSGASSRLYPGLVAALCLAQAGLFLGPPTAWTATVSDASLPAVEFADRDAADTLGAIRSLAAGEPDSVVVVAREARVSFRQAMFHLPALRVLWLLDADTTGISGRGVEVCEARGHATTCSSGRGFWLATEPRQTAEIDLSPTVREIVWLALDGPFLDQVRAAAHLRTVRAGQVSQVRVTDVPEGPFELRVGPYTFRRP